MGEIGATRALYQACRRPILLPITVGIEIPDVVKDVYVYRMDPSANGIKLGAEDIDRTYRTARSGFPKVFISHRHADRIVVEALVSLLTTAFDIQQNDLRVTSVRPYNLKWGAVTPDRLREELQFADAVIGVISPNSSGSSYVLFELGASWGRGMPGTTLPLLIRGATNADVPAPIAALNTLSVSAEADCHQLLDDLAAIVTSLNRKDGQEFSNRGESGSTSESCELTGRMTAVCAFLPLRHNRWMSGSRPFETSPIGYHAFDLNR